MSLAAIECLARSFCPGVCGPDEALPKILKLYPNMPDSLAKDISGLYCPYSLEAGNIRNRCLHGSFLEIESRAYDLIGASNAAEHLGIPKVDLTKDGSLPSNVSAIVMRVLRGLADFIETSGLTSITTWTNHFLLTSAELNEAKSIHCDVLRDYARADAWRKRIGSFLSDVTPALSTPLKWGLRCWYKLGADLDETTHGLFFQALLFEPFLRLVLHLAGKNVLQTANSNDAVGPHYRVQYLMLDTHGLLSADNVASLTDHFNSGEKLIAGRALEVAMKCRDAVAPN